MSSESNWETLIAIISDKFEVITEVIIDSDWLNTTVDDGPVQQVTQPCNDRKTSPAGITQFSNMSQISTAQHTQYTAILFCCSLHKVRMYLQLPLLQWGAGNVYLLSSILQLKFKHCRKPHCFNGVVDTFGQGSSFLYWLIIYCAQDWQSESMSESIL